MSRLPAYLVRLFTADAFSLLAIAAFLLFLIQCVRGFDVVAVRGQDVGTLIGQAVLWLPYLINAFYHVCVGIGLARALRALQTNQELHIIHASRRTGALFAAIALYSLGAAGIALVLTHYIEPESRRTLDAWNASITADLVGRTMSPQRFTPVTPGVTMFISARRAGGELREFFADDNRSETTRRTYQAETASVTSDETGYLLRLANGTIHYLNHETQRFSEIAFEQYDLPIEGLIGDDSDAARIESVHSFRMRSEPLGENERTHLGRRFETPLRLLGLCLFVAAIATFPDGNRRRRRLPIEVVVLAAAFLERGVSNIIPTPVPYVPVAGSFILGAIGIAVLWARLRQGLGAFRRSPA